MNKILKTKIKESKSLSIDSNNEEKEEAYNRLFIV